MPPSRRYRPAVVLPVLIALLLPASAAADRYEPNESQQQARGPLTGGGAYPGHIGTRNDVDWFYVYVNGQREIDLALTSLGEYCSTGAYAQLYDTDGYELGDTDNSCYNATGHFRYTTPGAGRYFIRVSGDEGASYELRIEPADALTTTPPAPPPPPAEDVEQAPGADPYEQAAAERAARCWRYRDRAADARSRLRTNRARLRRAQSNRARRRLGRRITRLRRAVARHQRGVWTYC